MNLKHHHHSLASAHKHKSNAPLQLSLSHQHAVNSEWNLVHLQDQKLAATPKNNCVTRWKHLLSEWFTTSSTSRRCTQRRQETKEANVSQGCRGSHDILTSNGFIKCHLSSANLRWNYLKWFVVYWCDGEGMCSEDQYLSDWKHVQPHSRRNWSREREGERKRKQFRLQRKKLNLLKFFAKKRNAENEQEWGRAGEIQQVTLLP